MKVLPLFLGAALILSPGWARATTIYDTVDVDPADFNANWDPVSPTAGGPDAASFSLPYTATLDTVSLELSATNPNDGGSLTVVLVQDTGTSPNNYPTNNADGNGITTFTNATVLATVLDSSLSGGVTPSLVTINTSVLLSPGTYWIGIETSQLPSSVADGDTAADGTYGSSQWWMTGVDPTGAIGVTGQNDFNAYGYPAPYPISDDPSYGAYEMIVDVPEPATWAVLGCSLVGLGYLRRRNPRNA